jgi:methionyl-tRNA formyltransferase
MKIVFMGTPDFAVASLDALLQAGYEIAGVVTAPDKPAGRGQKLSESAVKTFARSRGLTVLQPEKLRSPEFLADLRSLNADLQVVVAFRMLPEVVWNMPPKGTINLHASLLPAYRGAAPINWAIINGEKETGVSTFFLQQAIDTGNILLSERIAISRDETAGTLHDKLMNLGANVLIKTIHAIESGNYIEKPQPFKEDETGQFPKAPKLFREDCRIRWNLPAQTVYNKIRGLSPYPAAYTLFQDKVLKIYRAKLKENEPAIYPGGFLSDGKTHLDFACTDGYISLEEVQFEGKKRMPVADFLRGINL